MGDNLVLQDLLGKEEEQEEEKEEMEELEANYLAFSKLGWQLEPRQQSGLEKQD